MAFPLDMKPCAQVAWASFPRDFWKIVWFVWFYLYHLEPPLMSWNLAKRRVFLRKDLTLLTLLAWTCCVKLRVLMKTYTAPQKSHSVHTQGMHLQWNRMPTGEIKDVKPLPLGITGRGCLDSGCIKQPGDSRLKEQSWTDAVEDPLEDLALHFTDEPLTMVSHPTRFHNKVCSKFNLWFVTVEGGRYCRIFLLWV